MYEIMVLCSSVYTIPISCGGDQVTSSACFGDYYHSDKENKVSERRLQG